MFKSHIVCVVRCNDKNYRKGKSMPELKAVVLMLCVASEASLATGALRAEGGCLPHPKVVRPLENWTLLDSGMWLYTE
jgi:hypothetical protein